MSGLLRVFEREVKELDTILVPEVRGAAVYFLTGGNTAVSGASLSTEHGCDVVSHLHRPHACLRPTHSRRLNGSAQLTAR